MYNFPTGGPSLTNATLGSWHGKVLESLDYTKLGVDVTCGCKGGPSKFDFMSSI